MSPLFVCKGREVISSPGSSNEFHSDVWIQWNSSRKLCAESECHSVNLSAHLDHWFLKHA